MPSKKQNLDYLKLLAERYPNVESSVRAIVDMSSILRLPKGTEYFFSDLHGENGAFIQLLRSASGVIRDKIDTVYSFTLSEKSATSWPPSSPTPIPSCPPSARAAPKPTTRTGLRW